MILKTMISHYRKKIELYQAMIQEWEMELEVIEKIALAAKAREAGHG